MKEEYVMICPKCSSRNVSTDLSKDMIAWGGSTKYICNDCNYSAVMFPEVAKSEVKLAENEINKKTKKQNEVMSRYSFSKGFINKNVSTGLIMLYLFMISVSFSILFFGGYMKNNHFLAALLIVICLIFIFSLFYSKKY